MPTLECKKDMEQFLTWKPFYTASLHYLQSGGLPILR